MALEDGSNQPADDGVTGLERLSDGDLAAKVAQGDRLAAQTLILRYQVMVRSFLRRLTPDHALADDLAQDTFVRMLQHADRFDPKYAMKTWLLTIARRLLINHSRRAERRVVHSEFELTSSPVDTPASIAAVNDERRDARERLTRALATLSDSQRQAVVLFHQQDLSIQEVADVMQIPVGTVKSHLHRARASMRQFLAPQMEQVRVPRNLNGLATPAPGSR